MWYITHEPDEYDMRVGFGYRPDFNGLGVFVFKHEGRWRIQSIVNTGLQGLTVESAVNNLSKYLHIFQRFNFVLILVATPDNNCKVPNWNGGAIDIKFISKDSKLTVEYALDGDNNYRTCIDGKFNSMLRRTGYVGITSGNPEF